jgi:hypothetical protein
MNGNMGDGSTYIFNYLQNAHCNRKNWQPAFDIHE